MFGHEDYTHCLDYTDSCPQECFRAKITKDLKENGYPFPVSLAHLKGSDECLMKWMNCVGEVVDGKDGRVNL